MNLTQWEDHYGCESPGSCVRVPEDTRIVVRAKLTVDTVDIATCIAPNMQPCPGCFWGLFVSPLACAKASSS